MLFCVFSNSMANYNDGLRAYHRGGYTQAYKTWLKTVKGDGNITESFDWKRNTPDQIRDSQYGIGLLYWQGKGVEQEKLVREADPASLISKGFSRGQLPDNVVMLGSRPKPGKSEDAAEGSGFEFDPKPKSGGGSSGGAHVERLEDHIVNYHGDPCPECGHFTVIENAGLLGCDACGWAGKV